MASSLMLSPDSVLALMQKDPAALKVSIQNMLKVASTLEPAQKFSQDVEAFKQDLVNQKLRDALLALIDSNPSDTELKGLCVRLLLRIGLITANGENLLRAAILQKTYKIDLTDELEFFCKQSEIFKKPLGEGSGSGFECEDQTTIQSRVSFDRGSDRATETDQLCTDGHKWFIWSDQRGLTRGHKTPK